jgi:hypothetical protein
MIFIEKAHADLVPYSRLDTRVDSSFISLVRDLDSRFIVGFLFLFIGLTIFFMKRRKITSKKKKNVEKK